MIRGVLRQLLNGAIRLIDADARSVGEFVRREFFQHYGMSSRPHPGAEVIIIREGNHYTVVADHDRRYTIDLEYGEVALHTDEGDKVHLKRDRVIEVVAGNKLIATTKEADITASTSATVVSPTVTVDASTKVIMNTPVLEVSGNITSGGDITAAGNVADQGGTKTMSGMRGIFDDHGHPHPSDGVQIPAPITKM